MQGLTEVEKKVNVVIHSGGFIHRKMKTLACKYPSQDSIIILDRLV